MHAQTTHDKGKEARREKEGEGMDEQQNRAKDVHINRARTNGYLERKPVSVLGSQ